MSAFAHRDEMARNVFVAGVSFKTAPVEVREGLAVRPSRVGCLGCKLKVAGGLSEVVVLSTCNRVEIYGVNSSRTVPLVALFNAFGFAGTTVEPFVYVHTREAALRHLFSVISGLDSMVLGETEITGQVKTAYAAAKEARLTGPILNRVFQTALQAVKQIRTKTNIGRGATSVGSVAVELVEKIFGDLAQKTVMILGAGKMGEACVRHLAKRQAKSILVSNRSFERAQILADEVGGSAIRFKDSVKAMEHADIVVSSTGAPQLILHRKAVEAVMQNRRNRPLVLIDIAVPRDIHPEIQTLENVYLYNIDDLQALVRENVRQREQELSQCHAIVAEFARTLNAKISGAAVIAVKPQRVTSLDWENRGLASCASAA